jgi:hypothetical protein
MRLKTSTSSVCQVNILSLAAYIARLRSNWSCLKKDESLGSDGKWYIQDKSKIVTNVDGYKILGAHNYKPARAIDVAVVDNATGKYLWEEKLLSSTVCKLLQEIAGWSLEGEPGKVDKGLAAPPGSQLQRVQRLRRHRENRYRHHFNQDPVKP